jgi:hypothetical protein
LYNTKGVWFFGSLYRIHAVSVSIADCGNYQLIIWINAVKVVVYLSDVECTHFTKAPMQYSASHVDQATSCGMVDVSSTTAPCMNMRTPPVDLPESGQSWKEASEKTTIG